MNPCTWAKIVEVDGKHVLFYLEHDDEHDDCQIMHCYARCDGFDADMKAGGIPDAKSQTAFDMADEAMAARVLKQITALMES